jgi:hypothetical protein
MDIDVFSAPEIPTVLRALRTALRTEGALDSRERLFLGTYARIVNVDPPASDPPPVHARDVIIAGAHPRKRLLQLAALAVLLARPIRADSLQFLKALSQRLATHDPVIEVIDALCKGRHLAVRMRAMRRAMRSMFKEAHCAEGWAGVLRFAAAMFLKLSVNKDQTWRYRRLGLLPEGTLGREYWKHMIQAGFPFPGEAAGIPVPVSYHDVAHVLTGYAPSGEGEIQQGSFQGGNRREDGFFFVQFVILQFHHGVKVTPNSPPEFDHFDPAKVLWAIHRGAQCKVDVTHQWDYWDLMPLPLPEARARIGLLPKLAEHAEWRRAA